MQIDNIVHTQNCTGSNWGIACHSNNANGCCFDSCELLLLHLVIYTSPKFCEKLRNYTCSATCSCKYKQTLRNLEEWWGCHYHSTYLFKMKIRWNQCLESYVSSLHPNLDKTSASFEASRQPLIGFLQLVCSLLAFSESELLVYTSYTSYISYISYIYIYVFLQCHEWHSVPFTWFIRTFLMSAMTAGTLCSGEGKRSPFSCCRIRATVLTLVAELGRIGT